MLKYLNLFLLFVIGFTGIDGQAAQPIRTAIWSHSGELLLTLGETAQVWDRAGNRQTELIYEPGILLDAIWKADDSQIITLAQDDTAHVWEVGTGERLMTLRHDNTSDTPGPVLGAAWNQTQDFILTWTEHDPAARIWDATTGALVHALSHENPPILGAAWSQDGHEVLTWAATGSASLWHVTGHLARQVAHFPALGGTHTGGVVWSPDERQIIVWAKSPPFCKGCASFSEIHIWDIKTETLVHSLTHEYPIQTALWHPDGHRILAIPFDQPPRLWDSQTGVELVRMVDTVHSVSWLDDGRLAALFLRDGSLQMWDMNRIEIVWQRQFAAPLLGVDWAEPLAAAYSDKTITILNQAGEDLIHFEPDRPISQAILNRDGTQVTAWQFDESGAITWQIPRILPAAGGIQRAHWNPDGTQVALWARKDRIQIWDVATGQQSLELPYDISPISDGRWNHNGTQLLTWSWDNTTRIWNTITGQEQMQFYHDYRINETDTPIQVYGAVWNEAESQVLTWTSFSNSAASVWDAATGIRIFLLPHGRDNAVLGASWNRHETQILTWGTDGTARIWDALTGEPLHELIIQDALIYDAQWNADESAILMRVNVASFCFGDDCAAFHKLYIWDATTGEPIRTFDHDGLVQNAFWLDNRHVLSLPEDREQVYIWAVQTSVLKFRLGEGPISAIALSPDSIHLLTHRANDGLIQIWNVHTGHEVIHLEDMPAFHEVRWHPNGQLIATYHHAGDRGYVIDLRTGDIVQIIQHNDSISGMAWSPGGTHLLSWSSLGDSARIWNINVP